MVEGFGHHPLPLTAWYVFVGQGQIDVLLHRQVVEQVIALEDHADFALGQLGAVLALHQMHRLFAEPVFAGPLVVEQGEHIQQRGLSRARRTHDGDELAFLDGEINAAQYPGLSRSGFVTAFDVFELDHKK